MEVSIVDYLYLAQPPVCQIQDIVKIIGREVCGSVSLLNYICALIWSVSKDTRKWSS
jgi:hypothetical protein